MIWWIGGGDFGNWVAADVGLCNFWNLGFAF